MSSIDAKLIGVTKRFTADASHKDRILLIRYSPIMVEAMGTPMLVIDNGCRIVQPDEQLWAWAYANFDSLKDGETVRADRIWPKRDVSPGYMPERYGNK